MERRNEGNGDVEIRRGRRAFQFLKPDPTIIHNLLNILVTFFLHFIDLV